MKLNVPYYSQYDESLDKDWQRRACGLVCLKMVLDFHKVETPEINEFLKLVLGKGTYHNSNGWIHNKLLEIAVGFGVEAFRKEKMEDEEKLKISLDEGNPVIVSIKARRFLPEFEGKFHQIVLTGYNGKGFYYNDSDYQGNEGKDLFVPIGKFMEYWRKMAIFISF